MTTCRECKRLLSCVFMLLWAVSSHYHCRVLTHLVRRLSRNVRTVNYRLIITDIVNWHKHRFWVHRYTCNTDVQGRRQPQSGWDLNQSWKTLRTPSTLLDSSTWRAMKSDQARAPESHHRTILVSTFEHLYKRRFTTKDKILCSCSHGSKAW